MNERRIIAACEFSEAEWDQRAWVDSFGNPKQMLEGWRNSINLPPVPDEPECDELIALKSQRPGKKSLIEQQATRNVYTATITVQGVVGVLPYGQKNAAWKALGMLYDNLNIVVFYFKRVYKRGRPFMCCQNIEPMFSKGDERYPAHPAYPSGHAAQAYAMAYFYAKLFTHLRNDLMAKAKDIALNREIAGLHYPSDSEAGRILAEQVVDMLFGNATFKARAEAAAKDW